METHPLPSLNTWTAHAAIRSPCNTSTYHRALGGGGQGGKAKGGGESALLSEEQGELSLRGEALSLGVGRSTAGFG